MPPEPPSCPKSKQPEQSIFATCLPKIRTVRLDLQSKRAADAEGVDNPGNVEVIDVSDCQPRRLPSKKQRELINPPAMLRIAGGAGLARAS